ncbi:MAG: type II secretion system GspH family protein [Candidatus Riflebacteria bacterium]|nr:type II secretion system GspH family protein [Candidatus Riflebacteria bacterium]
MKNSRTAFTTPELLMTIVVFSFGLLPLIVLFQNSYKQTAQAKNLMVAHSLGRTMISEIRALGFEALEKEMENSRLNIVRTSKPVEGRLVDSDTDSTVYPEYYKRFNTSVKLERASTDNNKKIRVELDIEWKEPNRTFNLGFGTVVGKYGN